MNQVVLITGATGAIGNATAQVLARKGCHLILLGRSAEKLASLQGVLKQQNSASQIDTRVVDFTDLRDVQAAGLEIQQHHPRIHALIHTAAVFTSQRHLTPEGLETMFTVNHLAAFALTKVLFETIRGTPEARVLTVTAPSTTQLNFQDLMGSQQFNALNAFGASKMANLLFALKLGRSGLTSHALHPGLVRSELLREAPPLVRLAGALVAGGPERAAQAFAEIATDHRYLQNSGQFYHLTRNIQPPAYARSHQNQDLLWDASLKHLNAAEASLRG